MLPNCWLDVVAKFREPCGIHVLHQDVRVVHAPHFIVADVLAAQPGGHALDHLVGLLRDGLLHLHLNHELRAALQVEPELDLVSEIIFQLRRETWGTSAVPTRP